MEKPIRLVALDMDGTLLDSQKRLPKDFLPWVKNHPQIKTVISSGRQYYTLLSDFREVEDDILFSAENGGLVMEKGKVLFQSALRKEAILPLFSKLQKFTNLSVILCGVRSAYMLADQKEASDEAKKYYRHLTFLPELSRCPEMDSLIKIALYDLTHQAFETFEELRVLLPAELKGVVSGTCWIDVANEGVNKGTGIKKIQEIYQISPEESMAFGDYMNDYEMLSAVYHSYAMANACQEIKDLCRYQTASNDDDGVMKVLRKI